MTSHDHPGRDWHAWHRDYDDPSSSLSHRLEEVRIRLAALLEAGEGRVRLLSLCAGDGRDTIPVVAGSERDVAVTLVELDAELGARADASALAAGLDVDVRVADAGVVATWRDVVPVDVLMLCGVFGNIADADVEQTVAATASMVTAGGSVVWTRGSRPPADPMSGGTDPAERIRGLFAAAGFEEVAFVQPADASYRVGVARLTTPSKASLPDRLFTFTR